MNGINPNVDEFFIIYDLVSLSSINNEQWIITT